ncbi:MAG TPA: hypothetical protein ENI23_17305 [bacterium]|nr:hypothetical protein [bacterium]
MVRDKKKDKLKFPPGFEKYNDGDFGVPILGNPMAKKKSEFDKAIEFLEGDNITLETQAKRQPKRQATMELDQFNELSKDSLGNDAGSAAQELKKIVIAFQKNVLKALQKAGPMAAGGVANALIKDTETAIKSFKVPAVTNSEKSDSKSDSDE